MEMVDSNQSFTFVYDDGHYKVASTSPFISEVHMKLKNEPHHPPYDSNDDSDSEDGGVFGILKYFGKGARLVDSSRRLKSQIWSSVVTISLVEGKNLGHHSVSANRDLNSTGLVVPSNPCVKFRLGNEKYRSKSIPRTDNPQWREQFDLHMFDDQSKVLEVIVCDASRLRDDVLGKFLVDLTELESEKTHRISKELPNGNGSIFLLVTISGTTNSETISDLTSFEMNSKEKEAILRRYNLRNTFQNVKDIGHLTVKVYGAEGLASADIGGKSDPFCVLELVNARLQTQTEYKTLCPSWQKIFTLNIKDVHSILEVTVYDEDRDHKFEFLGKISIPLLTIKNNVRKWYVLKDKKLLGPAKGRILLEMEMTYNPIRACIATFNRKERKYMEQEEKFQRKVFVNNVMRVKAVVMLFMDVARFVQSCFDWDSPLRSVASFMLFLLLTYYFEVYMIPLAFLLLFLIYSASWERKSVVTELEEDAVVDDDEDEEDKDKEERLTLKAKLHAVHDVMLYVQKSLGAVASLWERIKNTFNFSVPFLSWLAITVFSIIAVILYYIPLRYLIMAWGINKFTKKLRSPDAISNNEILDFLSRVPDDEQLVLYGEIKANGTSESDKKGHKKKKSN